MIWEQLKRVDRAFLSLASAKWFVMAFLACVLMTITLSVLIPVPYDGIVHEAAHLVLPLAVRVADAQSNYVTPSLANFSSSIQDWSKAMQHIISTLVILGILLKAGLVGIELWKMLRDYLKKHPVLLTGAVATGVMLVAVAVVPESEYLIGGGMT